MKKPQRPVRVAMYLPAELMSELRSEAKRIGVPYVSIVREAIRKALRSVKRVPNDELR